MKRLIFLGVLLVSFTMSLFVFAEDVMRIPVKDKTDSYPFYSIMEAVYDSYVKDSIVYTQAKYKISIGQDRITNIPILFEELAIVKTNLPKGVLLAVNNGYYQLMFSKKGGYNVDIDFTYKIKKVENSNIFTFNPSMAVVSRLNFIIPGTNLDIEISPALSAQIKESGKDTQVIVFLGTTKEFCVKWLSKPQTISLKPMFLSESHTLAEVSAEVVRITSILNYEVRQGKVSKLKVNLPANINLIAVKGANLQNWDLKQGENTQILEVELSEEIVNRYQLTLEMEQSKDDSLVNYILPQITTVDAQRESGYIAVMSEDNFKIRAAEKTGLSQIDVKELPEVFKNKEKEISLAYRYLKQPAALSLNIQRVEPEITARNNIFLNVDEDLLKLNAVVDYDIRKAGVFGFNLEMPGDFTLIDVSGQAVQDWTVTDKENYQLLTVRLKSRAFGKYQLLVKMEKSERDVLGGISVPNVKVLNVTRETGYIGISGAANIKLITGEKNNIAEVDISELSVEPGSFLNQCVLAYKYIEQPYVLKLAVEEVEPRLTAEVFTFTSVGEGFLLMDSVITYNILYAGTDEFTAVFPEDVQVVDVTGKNIKFKEEVIREREADGRKIKEKVVKVRLHSKVKGEYNLYCSYEKPMEGSTAAVELPKLQVLNVTRESGFYCLGTRMNAEIKSGTVLGAVPIDITELPQDKAKGIDVPLVLAFKYVRHPYNICIDVEKHQDIAVLVAMAESAKITTMLTKDGQIIVDAFYYIKNKQKQYLNIYLPADVNIWSVFVNNKPVRPSRVEGGNIVIPLEKSSREDVSFPVEIIYETKQHGFAFLGKLGFIQPRLDIPVTNAVVRLYLPEEFIYTGFGGNMNIVKRHTGNQIMSNYSAGESLSRNKSLSQIEVNKEELPQDAKRGGQRKDDDDFRDNIISQKLRYLKYMEKGEQQGGNAAVPYQSEVSEGKLAGALPIHVTIPTGGKLFTFNKLLSSNENLVVSVVYITKAVMKILWTAVLSGLTVIVISIFRGFKAKKMSNSKNEVKTLE